MKICSIRIVAVAVLVFCASVAFAQAPDDAIITQLKGTVQNLEALVGDANVPKETREQLNELLFEKRGELHSLLRQKRDALRSRQRAGLTPRESNAVAASIRQLEQDMRQLMKAAATPPGEGSHPQTENNRSEIAGSESEANAASTERAASEPTTVTSDVRVPSSLAVPSESAVAAPVTNPSASNLAPANTSTSLAVVTPPDAAPVQGPCSNIPSGAAPPDIEYQRQITRTACRIVLERAKQNPVAIKTVLNFQQDNFLMALAIARAKLPKVALPELTAQAEDASHAKNLSSGDAGSGSTSLVSKAGLPAVFGFATEHGGLTRSTDGTTVTFTGNPVGIVQMMAQKGFITSFQEQDDFTKFLRKFSFGLSYDTSRGTQAGTFTGSRQQLSGFSFKFNAIDQRDPRDKKHTDRWLKITNAQASDLALSLNNFVRALVPPDPNAPVVEPTLKAFNDWLTNANQALAAKSSAADLQDALAAELEKLGGVELPAEQKALVERVGTDFEAFIEERNNILDEISNGWIATFDYNNTRPVGTPSLSNFRFLAEKGAYNGSIDFTGNASVTIYNSRPSGPNAQTLRDFRFAGQLDVPIGDITRTGKFLISLGGRYQRLLEDEPIVGSTLVVPKGDIAALQAKLTIPIRGTAFKIPLSFSYANRTELIKEREIRGNFGFTFDLDSIFARFNPFSK